MKTPLYCLPHLFSNFVHSPPQSFCCLVSLSEWVILPHLMLFYLESIDVEPWNLRTRRTLPCVLCNKALTLLRSNTWRGPTHPYKYILTPPVMCSQQLSVSHWISDSLITKIYVTDFHGVSAFQKLLTCRSHISVD